MTGRASLDALIESASGRFGGTAPEAADRHPDLGNDRRAEGGGPVAEVPLPVRAAADTPHPGAVPGRVHGPHRPTAVPRDGLRLPQPVAAPRRGGRGPPAVRPGGGAGRHRPPPGRRGDRRPVHAPAVARRAGAGPVGLDLSSLRAVLTSGAALGGDLGTRFMAAFGPCLYNLYGSSETGFGAIATPDDLRAAPGTVGYPPAGTEVRILGTDGQPLPAGQIGRVFLRPGWRSRATSGAGRRRSIDGFMSTGDLGHLDAAGRLFIDGRADDMIISGGENVFPGEVEEVLAGHPGVAEVAVVGVPDEQFGQRLRAFVVARAGACGRGGRTPGVPQGPTRPVQGARRLRLSVALAPQRSREGGQEGAGCCRTRRYT